MRAVRSGLQKQILNEAPLVVCRDPNFFVTASPKVQPCWDIVVAGLVVMVPQEAEPNEPRGIFLEQGVVPGSVQHLHTCSAEVQKTRQSCCHQCFTNPL